MTLPFGCTWGSRTGQSIVLAFKTARDDAMDTDKAGQVHKLNKLTANADAHDCFFSDFSTRDDRLI